MTGQVAIPYLLYDDAEAAIVWLEATFGFETITRQNDRNGKLFHAEIRLGEARVMLGGPGEDSAYGGAATAGHKHAMVLVYVDAVEPLWELALKANANVLWPLNDTPYGDRMFGITDPEGQCWSFHQKGSEGTA